MSLLRRIRSAVAPAIALVVMLAPSPAGGFVIDYVEILLDGAKVGFIDKSGHVVIEPKFERANGFSGGRAAVRVAGQWGYIDRTGTLVVPARYSQAEPFSEGLAAVAVAPKGAARRATLQEMRWGYVDSDGKEVVAPEYQHAGPFQGGLALIKQGDRYGYIGRNGKRVIEPQYRWAAAFSEGMAAVVIDDKTGFIDRFGKMVIKPQFVSAEQFSGGLAPVEIELGLGTQWGYIDRTGKIVVEPKYDRAFPFSEGRALVQKEKKSGFIDATGAVVIPIKFWEASPFSEGLARVAERSDETGVWGYVDADGRTVIQNKRIYSSFRDGLAIAQVYETSEKDCRPMGSWGFFNKTGRLAFPARLEWAGPFSEGLAPFATGCNHERVRKAQANDSWRFGGGGGSRQTGGEGSGL